MFLCVFIDTVCSLDVAPLRELFGAATTEGKVQAFRFRLGRVFSRLGRGLGFYAQAC